jgi:hypothetical protein
LVDKNSLSYIAAGALLCTLLFCAPSADCKDSSVRTPSADKPGEESWKGGDLPSASMSRDSKAAVHGADLTVPSVVLSFPTEYSAGSLYKVKQGHAGQSSLRISRTFFAAARGKVVVPRGLLLSLTVSYQGAQDLSSLDRLPPGVVAFLKIERLSVTDQQFKALKSLPDLKGLELVDVDITDRGIMQLQNCHNLIFASLKSSVVTGKGLAAFRNLKTLQHLDFEQNLFDDASLSNLSGLTDLYYLRLKDCRLTDAGLKHLQPLSNLVELVLSINKITDAGVASLLPLRNLRSLNITDTKVTMASVASLAKFPKLRELTISQVDFTPAQLEEMRRRLPHCHINDGKNTGADLRIFAPLH